MLLVKFETKPSEFGLGNFAGEDIAKGTVVWMFDPDNCQKYFSHTIDQMPEDKLSHLWKGFTTPQLDMYILLEDGAQYTNHGQPANLQWGENTETWVAAVDISQ